MATTMAKTRDGGRESLAEIHGLIRNAALEGDWAKIEGALARLAPEPGLARIVIGAAASDAAYNGHAQCLRRLIVAGADVDAGRTESDWPGACSTAMRGHAECLGILIEAGCDIEARTFGSTPLMLAAAHGTQECVGLLIAARADLNAVGPNGETASMNAVNSSELEIMAKLVAAGADLNIRNKLGATALAISMSSGKADVANILLGAGADASIPMNSGMNLADLAAEGCHAELLAMALDLGVKLGAFVPSSPYMHAAALRGSQGKIEALMRAGLDVNELDSRGRAVAMSAVWGKHDGVLAFLFARGVDFEARDESGLDVFDLARERGWESQTLRAVKERSDLAIQTAGSGRPAPSARL